MNVKNVIDDHEETFRQIMYGLKKYGYSYDAESRIARLRKEALNSFTAYAARQ